MNRVRIRTQGRLAGGGSSASTPWSWLYAPWTLGKAKCLEEAQAMRTAHLLRKYNPLEWGGTETAVQRLLDGLTSHGIQSVVFAPHCESGACDPLGESGHQLRRFSAFVPVARITSEQKHQLVSIGGNLMSFDLGAKLLLEPGLALIHTHTLNRLGGIALTVARVRR